MVDETNREYRDRLFKFIFGNPENKEWTLSLYNAINGSHYTDAEVTRMCITEYDEARAFAEQREEGWEEGRAEEREEIISGLLRSGMSREEIQQRLGF